MKPPNRSHAVMTQRNPEDRESLDPFPTPCWATRAFVEHILGNNILGNKDRLKQMTCWEPACGEGHMVKPLREYFGEVRASDIHPYGFGDVVNFLEPSSYDKPVDWIITNPPFRMAEAFIDKANKVATQGIAMLTRTVFLEGCKRYESLFSKNPPNFVAQYAERVPMVKGRLDRNASTATSYSWLIWDKLSFNAPQLMWIPPSRKTYEKDSDYEN